MRTLFFFIGLLIFLPSAVLAGTADLSLAQGGISFSKETLTTGDTVRIYAVIKNVGEVDVSGYVSFYQGSLPIGDSQVISLRAGGLSEEVYVDFVVPSGAFNIRAEIKGTDPQDENDSNNSLFTQLYTPILDDDRDGIENVDDNCPSIENSDQTDTDLDDKGDACDDDDDNDGLTDSVEHELGTDPKKNDSDGDGLLDAADPHPTTREDQIVTAAPVTVSESVTSESTLFDSQKNDSDEAIENTEPVIVSEDLVEDVKLLEATEVSVVSPNAIFAYQKTAWNTYFFKAQLPDIDGYRVTWNFGDGVTSTKEEVAHTYRQTGDFTVKILVEGADGQTTEDSVVVHVPFFSLENIMIQFLIAVLFFALIILVILFRRAGKDSRPKMKSVKKTTINLVSSGPRKISVRNEDEDE